MLTPERKHPMNAPIGGQHRNRMTRRADLTIRTDVIHRSSGGSSTGRGVRRITSDMSGKKRYPVFAAR